MSSAAIPLSRPADAARIDPSPEELFRSLADVGRVRIVNVLAAGELCVCDLVDLLELPQPTISRHLAILRRNGLVRVARRGRFAHYRLADPEAHLGRALLAAARDGLASPELTRERARAAARVLDRRRNPCG